MRRICGWSGAGGWRPGVGRAGAFFRGGGGGDAARILIDQAPARKAAVKHGGQARRIELDEALMMDENPPQELLALDEALAELAQHDPTAAQLVNLRYFAGLTHIQAA